MQNSKKTFEVDKCPECGGLACSVVETVEISTPIESKTDGVYFFTGGLSETHYDTSSPKIDGEGQVELSCESRHTWETKLLKSIELGEIE